MDSSQNIHGASPVRGWFRRSMPALALVTLFAGGSLSQAQLPHPDDPAKQQEHLALYELVPRNAATHVSVSSGPWSNASTWSTGSVPGPNARVLIDEAHTVTYNRNSGDALAWVRVDGTLRFNPNINTRIVMEHLIVDPAGVLEIGTAASPIAANRTAIVEIDTSGGPISQAANADPFALGRGLMTHGRTRIHGAPKKAFTTLAADARTGDTILRLSDSSIPAGWQVGDMLVVAGTDADLHETHGQNWFGVGSESAGADANNERFRDEIVEISSMSVVNGKAQIRFINRTNPAANGSPALLWDHARIDGDLFNPGELSVHVANLSRNVVVKSSDPSVPIQERGHFMIMHNRDADIRYMLAQDLGRSDKSRLADDPAALGNFVGGSSTGTNPRGRYGIHFHRVGGNLNVDQPAMLIGSVVWGTPGWGIVHHDSYAILEENVVFDVVGAGIVAEDGVEVGEWRNNLVIKATGEAFSDFSDGHLLDQGRQDLFDLGFVGSGYWVQGGGAGLLIENNTAVSCNAAGFDIVPNTGLVAVPYGSIPTQNLINSELRTLMLEANKNEVDLNAATTAPLRGIEVYNSFRGIHTWLYNRDDQDREYQTGFAPDHTHDIQLVIENFKIWHVMQGVQNFYSRNVLMRNGLVVGDPDQYIDRPGDFFRQDNNGEGIGFTSNGGANTHHFRDLRIEGFEYTLRLPHGWNKGSSSNSSNFYERKYSPYAITTVAGVQAANVLYAFHGAENTAAFFPYNAVDSISINSLDTGNAPPVATFTAGPVGGFAYYFDATGSYDADPHPHIATGDPGIASFAWDFNSDGEFDAWGIDTVMNFGSPGVREVTLTVFDSHGATATEMLEIDVQGQTYPNPLVDPGFDTATDDRIDEKRFASGFKAIDSRNRDEGWFGDNFVQDGGSLRATGVPYLQQVIRDEFIIRGEQTLDLRIRHTSTQSSTADLYVTVYGVNGQFYVNQEDTNGNAIRAVQNSLLPVEAVPVIRENIGGPQYANWRRVSLTGDFGTGYEYLVVHLSGSGQDIAGGDYFAIDSASLTGAAPEGNEATIDFEQFASGDTAPSLLVNDSNTHSWTFAGLSNSVKVYDRNGNNWLGTVFNGDEGFEFGRTDGASFNLVSLDVKGQVSYRTYILTGHLASGQTISTTIELTSGGQEMRLEFDGWTNLVALEFDNGDQGDGRIFVDNIVTFAGEGSGVMQEDVALGKEARWGSNFNTWSSGSDAAAIVDGDPATGVGTSTGTSKVYQWYAVDLGASYTVEEVVHVWADDRHRAVDYEIQISDDGASWETIQTVTGNADISVGDTVTPTAGRYFRLKVNLSGFGPGGLQTRVILKDLQVMAR